MPDRVQVALVLVACLATSFARDVAFQRALQQTARPVYTCGQAQLLQGPGCVEMLKCLQASFPALVRTASTVKLFKDSCDACAKATVTCKDAKSKAGPIPRACQAGLSIKPVTDCVTKLLRTAARPAGH